MQKKGILTLAMALLVLCIVNSANAGIIDTGAPDMSLLYGDDDGPDVVGGTFTADASVLVSFTLNLDFAFNAIGDAYRAVVLGTTTAGVPTVPVLWESADITPPDSPTEVLFNVGIAIIPGLQYFIGIDSGNLTSTIGGAFGLGFRTSDVLAGGQLYQSLNTAPFFGVATVDIASRIVMASSVPEPASLILLTLGLAALQLGRRKTV